MKKLKEKRTRKLMIISAFILVAVLTISFLTNAMAGVGISMAMGLIIAGVELTPEQEKHYNAMLQSIQSEIDKNQKGYISESKANELINAHIKEYSDKWQMKAGDIEGLTEFVEAKTKEIAEAVKKLEENQQGLVGGFKSAIKTAFNDKSTVAKIKELKSTGGNVDVIEIKAVGNITTGSVTTDTGGNSILDLINTNDVNMNRLASTFIENYASVTNTSSPVVSYADYLPKDGSANFAAETGTAGQIDFKIETRTATAKKVYAYEVISEDAQTDIPRLQSFANQILLQKTLLKRQNGILFGDGIGTNPTGVTIVSAAFNPASWTGDKIVSPNLLDDIRACANQIYTTQNFVDEIPFMPNLCFVNPSDWFAFIGTKSDFGTYVFPQFTFNETNKVDTFTVIPNVNIPSGKILVGDFTKLNIVNYVNYNVKVGVINEQLINGLFTIVGYNRFMTYVKEYDKKGFVYDDIATVKAAIELVQA